MAESGAGVAGWKLLRAIVWVIYAAAVVAIIVLAFAFVLLMFNANPANAFAQAVAQAGTFFAQPFVALVRPTPLGNGGTIAWSLLFAIAAYAVVVAIATAALAAIRNRVYRSTHPQVVGERMVTTVHREQSGDVVRTATRSPMTAEQQRMQSASVPAPAAADAAPPMREQQPAQSGPPPTQPAQAPPDSQEPVPPPVPAGVGAGRSREDGSEPG